MTTNVLVTFYSTYGHVHRMAVAVAEGAESVPDSTAQLRRIAELEDAQGVISPGRLCAGAAGAGQHSCGHA
jgi:NAD(P)H dehydrogenase (quinone)